MNPKTIIVGGAGYIGGELCRQYESFGEPFTIYDSFLYGDRLPDYKQMRVVQGDIRDSKKLKAELETHDVIIWLAAIVGEPACELDSSLAWDVNATALSVLRDIEPRRVVFTSTASVYGVSRGLIREGDHLNPLGVYAESKVAAEKTIMASGHKYAILRLGTAFGIREYTRKRFDLAINAMTRNAVEAKCVSVYGGVRVRPFIHISDIARAIGKLAHAHGHEGVFNISSFNMSLLSLAERVAIATNAVIRPFDITEGDMRDYAVDTTKAARAALVNPAVEFPLDMAIGEISAWVRGNENYSEPVTNVDALRAVLNGDMRMRMEQGCQISASVSRR